MKIRPDLAAELDRKLKSAADVCKEQARGMAAIRELRTKISTQSRRTEELRTVLPHLAAAVQLGERPIADLEAAKAELEQARLEETGAGDAAGALRNRLRPAEAKIRALVLELAETVERIADSIRVQMLQECGGLLSDVVAKIDALGGRTDTGHQLSVDVLKNAPILRSLAPALEQVALFAAAQNAAGVFVEVGGRLLPESHPAAVAARTQADATARGKLGQALRNRS